MRHNVAKLFIAIISFMAILIIMKTNRKKTTLYYLAYAFNTLFLLGTFILISLIALN